MSYLYEKERKKVKGTSMKIEEKKVERKHTRQYTIIT